MELFGSLVFQLVYFLERNLCHKCLHLLSFMLAQDCNRVTTEIMTLNSEMMVQPGLFARFFTWEEITLHCFVLTCYD